jgi:hypothetical protein
MKRIIFITAFLVAMVTTTTAQSYTPISHFYDTVATAQSNWWTTIDLKVAGPQRLEVVNLGLDTLLVVFAGADTGWVGKSANWKRVFPWTSLATTLVESRYLYVRAKTTNCLFHAGNF